MIHPQRYLDERQIQDMESNVARLKNESDKHSCFHHRKRYFIFSRKNAKCRDYYKWMYFKPCALCTRYCCKNNFSYHGVLCILILLRMMLCYIGIASFASILFYQSNSYPSKDWKAVEEQYNIWAALGMLIHGLYFMDYLYFFYHLRKINRKQCDIWCKTCWIVPLLSIGKCIYAGIETIYVTATVTLYCCEIIWLLIEVWMWYEARKQLKSKEPTDLGVRGLLRPKELRVPGIELPPRIGGYDRSTYMEAETYLLRNNAHLKPIPTEMDTNLHMLKKREERLKREEEDEEDEEEDKPGGLLSPWKVGKRGSLVHIRDLLAGHKNVKSSAGPGRPKLRSSSDHGGQNSEAPTKKFAVGALDLLEHRMEKRGQFGSKRRSIFPK